MSDVVTNFFVTGPPRVGKSTLIDTIIRELGPDIGGFITKEVREDGERRGFQVITLDGETATLADIELDSQVRVGKYGVNMDVVDNFILPIIRRALDEKTLVLIDEIGNMQIASRGFCNIVTKALDSDKIVLATIHAHQNQFTDDLKVRSDVQMFELTPENRNFVRDDVASAIQTAITTC